MRWAEIHTSLRRDPDAVLVERDIREELEAHLAMSIDDLVAMGHTPKQAEEESRQRFGDFDATVRGCRRVRLGEKTMIQRVNLILLVLLALAVVYVGAQASATRADTVHALGGLQRELGRISTLLERDDEDRSKPLDRADARLANGRTTATAPSDEDASADVVADQPSEGGDSAEDFLRRFNDAWPLQESVAIALDLAELGPEQALAILDAIYTRIESDEMRAMLIEPMIASHPEFALRFLNFGVNDTTEVAAAAQQRCSAYAFIEFASQRTRFDAWWSANRDSDASDALRAGASDWVQRLADEDVESLRATFSGWSRGLTPAAQSVGMDLSAELRARGIEATLARLITHPHVAIRRLAWKLIGQIELGADFVLNYALPLLEDPATRDDSVIAGALLEAIARIREPWATEALRNALVETPARADHSFYDVSRALSTLGDPIVIPTMIGMIVADNTYKTIYGIGHFGLSQLTGVRFDDAHDGDWWVAWWQKNRRRFEGALANATIPTIPLRR